MHRFVLGGIFVLSWHGFEPQQGSREPVSAIGARQGKKMVAFHLARSRQEYVFSFPIRLLRKAEQIPGAYFRKKMEEEMRRVENREAE